MTLPTDIIFPDPPKDVRVRYPAMQDYLDRLNETLMEMYQELAIEINGTFKNQPANTPASNDNDFLQWTPVISGETVAGTGTYGHQIGFSLRQGLMVDVWFDISWTAHTGTGNMYITLPYKVALAGDTTTGRRPFVGVVQTNNLTYPAGTSYITCSARSNAFNLDIYGSGSATAIAQVQVENDTSAQIMGHCRYVGQAYERA